MANRRYGSKEAYERAKFMKNGERCGNCYFHRPVLENLNEVYCKRQLRAFPMPSGQIGKIGQLVMWPQLPKTEWCGDWKAEKPLIVIDGDNPNTVQN